MDISDNRYVALTTFTRDRRRKNCPIWIAPLGERVVGFTTESTSWKAKRISNTPSVELVASNARGVPIKGSEIISGEAHLVFGEEFEEVQSAISEKYGFQFSLIIAIGRIKEFFGRNSSSSCGVVIKVLR